MTHCQHQLLQAPSSGRPCRAPEQWGNALCVNATVEQSDGGGFNADLSIAASFELAFSDSISMAGCHEIFYHAAGLLGYDVLNEDRFNEFDEERHGEPVVVELASRRPWWRFW